MTNSPSSRSIETYLKYAAVPYAFGFFTVMVHTARYGLPVIQLIDPINVWVGAFPSLFLLAVWKLFQLPQASSGSELTRQLIGRIGLSRTASLNVTLSLISIALLLCAARVRLVAETPHYQLRAWLAFSLLLVTAFTVNWVKLSTHYELCRLLPSSRSLIDPVYRWLVRVWVVLVALLVFRAYVTGIYPNLPLRYGFGRPAPVRLIVNPQMVPHELLETNVTSVEAPIETQWVLLLYRTGQEHIVLCEQCKAKILSLSNAAVSGVIWKESSTSPNFQPK